MGVKVIYVRHPVTGNISSCTINKDGTYTFPDGTTVDHIESYDGISLVESVVILLILTIFLVNIVYSFFK